MQDRLGGLIAAPDGAAVPGPNVRWTRPAVGGLGSPEQIANRLRVDFPDDESMRISHEAIQGRGALRRELTACLRTGRALRVPRARARGRGKTFVPQVRGFARIGRRESTSSDPHGVALNNDGNKLYITVEYAEVPGIVVYDVEAGTVKKIDTVIAGNYLWVHPRTDKLYFPTRDDRVIVIDTKTDRILNVIRLHEGSRPNGVDFGGPNDEVWVNGDGDGSVTVIDSTTDEVIAVIQPRVKGGGRVAVSPDGRFAAATQGPEVSIINTRTKEIVASLRISPNESGHGFPLFSPDSNTLHVMNELSGDMVTFDMRTMRQVGTRTPIGGAAFGGGIRVLER